MTVGKLNYKCVRCNSKVELDVIPEMSEKTKKLWTDLFDSKLCLDCHCNSKVPALVECLTN